LSSLFLFLFFSFSILFLSWCNIILPLTLHIVLRCSSLLASRQHPTHHNLLTKQVVSLLDRRSHPAPRAGCDLQKAREELNLKLSWCPLSARDTSATMVLWSQNFPLLFFCHFFYCLPISAHKSCKDYISVVQKFIRYDVLTYDVFMFSSFLSCVCYFTCSSHFTSSLFCDMSLLQYLEQALC
jgi:hypothetical protein